MNEALITSYADTLEPAPNTTARAGSISEGEINAWKENVDRMEIREARRSVQQLTRLRLAIDRHQIELGTNPIYERTQTALRSLKESVIRKEAQANDNFNAAVDTTRGVIETPADIMTQGPWRRAITTVLAVTGLATATNWVLKHVFRMKDREATAASGTTPAQPARPNWGRRIAAWGLAIGGLFALPLLGKRTGLLNSDRARVTPGTTPAGTPPAALGSSPERHDTRVQEDVSVRPGGDFQDTGVAVVDATTTNIQIAPVGSRTPRVIAITALAGNAEVAVPEHGLVIRRNANVIQVKVTDPSKVGTTVNIGAFGAGPSPVTWQRLDVEGETEPPADQIQGEYVADNRRRIIDIPEATGGAPRQRVFTLNNPDAVVTVEGRTVENRAGNVIPHPDFPGATLTIDRSGAQLTFKPALTGAAVGQRIHWGVWVGGRKYNIGVAR